MSRQSSKARAANMTAISLRSIPVILAFGLWVTQVFAYNLHTHPVLTVRDPRLLSVVAKTRSSYFGYSLVLQEKSILVGAPRSQYPRKPLGSSQLLSNEPGAVFRCPLLAAQPCLHFDMQLSHGWDITTNQWLGATLVGRSDENSSAVAVCAPRLGLSSEEDMQGKCYWIPSERQSSSFTQIGLANYLYKHTYALVGFSLDMAHGSRQLMMGAVGYDYYKVCAMRGLDDLRRVVRSNQLRGDLPRATIAMLAHTRVFVLFGVLAELCSIAAAFNVAPHPVRVLLNPSTLGQSYFGYSLVYRDGSLLVGAPRHQSASGEIFQCDIDRWHCQPFAALSAAHLYANMWLGATMAGGGDSSDDFVVCGPGFPKMFADYTLMHGICYALGVSGDVTKLSKIHAMNDRRKQFGKISKFVYALGESGFSLSGEPQGRGFVIGAPGVNDWTGAVLFFNAASSSTRILPFKGDYFSYFGYAVSSGYLGSSSAGERPTLLYVATAPRVGDAAGEAIITDSYRVRAVLNGTQYGEYFGYSALVIDVNGDGLDDICIGAPQYAAPTAQLQYDNGAVYVFLNKGNENFERSLILSPFEDASRFGTTLSSLGDINLDGYQDLVIGAPFANGNGAVAIYLGSANGLSPTPSQILTSQKDATQKEAMFGHGLSRGFDVDGNGYNDLAVGAPEAESVYVYKSYPVVKVIVSMQAKTPRLERKLGEPIIVETCHRIETNATKMGPNVNITLIYKIDPHYKRAQFAITPPGDLYKAVVASGKERRCFNLSASTVLVKMANRPLRISMEYQLEQTPKENEEEFCENCAVLDPRDDHTLAETIPFLTDCGNECQVELAVRKLSAPENITLGVDQFLSIRYEVENSGQMSFDAVLNVIAWTAMPFSKYPATCNVVTANERMHQLSCELARSREFQGVDTVEFIFDASSQLDEEKLSMHVTIGSDSGVESNKMDNEVLHTVQVLRNSYVSLLGASTTNYIQLSQTMKELPVEYRLKLLNTGPSALTKSRLHLRYPVGYRMKPDGDPLPLVNVSSMQLYSYSASKNARYLDLRVREVNDAGLNITSPQPIVNNQLILNCNNTKEVLCVQAEVELELASGGEIELKLNYALSAAIAGQLTQKFDYLTLEWDYELVSDVELKGQITMSANLEGTSVVNIKKKTTPLWVYIISILIGLLTLVPVIWGLRKANFFKRQTPEEMAAKVHKRESITKMQSESVVVE